MTQDEIVEMARQVCDIDTDKRGRHTFVCDEYGLEAFAKLVAQRTKNRIFKRAEIAAELAIEHAIELEREECIKICDQAAEYFPSSGFVGSYIASKIKDRGNP